MTESRILPRLSRISSQILRWISYIRIAHALTLSRPQSQNRTKNLFSHETKFWKNLKSAILEKSIALRLYGFPRFPKFTRIFEKTSSHVINSFHFVTLLSSLKIVLKMIFWSTLTSRFSSPMSFFSVSVCIIGALLVHEVNYPIYSIFSVDF